MSYVTITYLPITAIDDIHVQEKLFPSSIFYGKVFYIFFVEFSRQPIPIRLRYWKKFPNF